MPLKHAFLCLLFWAVLYGQILEAQGTHEHGVAELNIAAQEQILSIEFLSPAVNLLGFERMPASAEEWTRLASVVEQIETITWLFGAQLRDCEVSIESLETPSFSASSHDHSHEHEGGHDHASHAEELDGDSHGDFRVQYRLNCLREIPAELEVTAFQHFPNLQQITTQWISKAGAGFSQLTAGSAVLSME